MAHTCNPSTWKVEAGGLEIWGHPCLYTRFKASLGYMRSCLKYQGKGTSFLLPSFLFKLGSGDGPGLPNIQVPGSNSQDCFKRKTKVKKTKTKNIGSACVRKCMTLVFLILAPILVDDGHLCAVLYKWWQNKIALCFSITFFFLPMHLLMGT